MSGADRKEAADRVAAILARIEPPSEEAGRTEEEIMEDVLADIAAARKQRRDRKAIAIEDLSHAEIEAIRRAEPPAEAAQYDDELTGAHGADC
ncbi:MAG: hypothetical protein OYG32_07525 [Rhodospirillaceae bacterium]|nr:hypothetical protein [Rhodospirillaceae bacterium]MDE0254630.1 hypothetical protein [Rhodospirillaceae bacterium]MDE0617160.1 hypothetical protein [Rhodospirillaceae bacterium]